MKKELIEIGSTYHCLSSLLDNTFSGTLVAVYENTCIVEVLSCAEEDTQKAVEYNNRFVVKLADLHQ